MLGLFPKVPKIQRPKALKIDVLDYQLSFGALSPENSRDYPHKPYIARNQSHWASFSLPTARVYLRSNFSQLSAGYCHFGWLVGWW